LHTGEEGERFML